MIQIEEILSESIVKRLGWALVHFVWQGIVIAILLALGMRMLRRGSSNSRYAIGCGAMMIMILLPIVTVLRTEAPAPTGPREEVTAAVSPASPIMPGTLPTAAVPPELVEKEVRPERSPESPVVLSEIPASKPHRKAQPSGALERALPWAVAGWLIGVVFLSLRLLGGWAQMQRLKGRFVKPVAQRWQQVFINLSRRIQLSRPVRVLESALAQVPTVIGWFKPAILLPTSALTGLSAEQVEALLAHELAHIRRHDYFVNLLQTIVETLLFYHPAVWWVSHRVRVERENCCDDLAVVVCGNEVAYARALTEMEQLRGVARRPAVAASGGSLLHRIRRLLGKRGRESNRSTWWLAGVLVLSSVLVLGMAVRMSGSQPRQESSTAEEKSRDWQIDIEGLWPEGQVLDGAGEKYGTSGRVYAFDPADPKLRKSVRKRARCGMLDVRGLDFINEDERPRVDVAFEFRDGKITGGALFELTLLDEKGDVLATERVLELRNRELPVEASGHSEMGGDDPPNRSGKAEFRFGDISLDREIHAYRLKVGEADRRRVTALLEHKDPYVREGAARALGQMDSGAREAVTELRRLLADQDAHVRGAAAQALQRIGSATSSTENSQGLTFGGLDLTGVPATTDPNKLADLFEPGPESGPHYLREGVEVVHQDGVGDTRGYLGSVYSVKEKNVFYIRYGPPRWTENRKYYGPFQGDPREVLRLEKDSAWLDKLWVTWIAHQETVKSARDGYPGVAAKAIVRGWNPAALETSEWEIRTADGKQRVARIPFAWPNSPTVMPSGGKRIEGGRSRTCRLEPNRSQLAWVNSLEDGEYLLGWNIRGRRVSNVLRFAIKKDYDIKQEPLLRLIEIEPAPGEGLSILALRAYRRTAADPAPLSSAIAYPTLIVDGRERRVTHMTWTGPDAPLKVGGQTCHFLHLEYYSPPIKPGEKHTVVARVDGHESAPITLTSERRLSERWDRDTVALGPPPGLKALEVVLSGKVIGTHGKPSRGYDVSLVGKDGLRETVETNDDGTYAFHANAVPAGRYEVCACPHGQGQPILTVRGVDLGEEQPRELDLSLEWKFSFGGRVTYPDGLPAQGWTVMGTWASPDGSAEYNNFATADMDGRYTLRAPYEVASFVGWGGKQVRRSVKAGQKDVDFAAPAKEGGGTEGMLTASDEDAGYVRRYGHDGYELEAGFTPEKAKILLGEPIFLTFSVKNVSNKAYGFFIGGDIRGSVRHNKFRIAAVDEEGRPVRDPHSYNDFGGKGGEVELQPGESYTERLYLGFWCEFEKAGTYTVTCKRTLDFGGRDAKYPAAPIVTAFKLTIGPYDKERMNRVIADLGKRLREGDKKEVYMATLGLAAIDDEQVIPHLAVSLTKGDFENRLPAVEGLSRFSTESAATALVTALKDPDYVVSKAAGKALQEMKTRDLAVNTLLGELGSPLSSERTAAARALGYTGAERALTPLIMAMDDAMPAVREAAAEALGNLGLQQAMPVLEKRVARQDMGMRVAAAKGLMALGKPLQVEWLTPVIRNTTDISNQDFHESIRLIRLYGKERGAAALVSCLKFDDPSPRSQYNFFLILGIEYSPNGPKYYTKFYHDPNTDGTPQQIQGNREILAALKAWLAEFELEKGKMEPSPEAGGEAAAAATAGDEGTAQAASRVWGEAVNGLRAAVEFVPEKATREIGEALRCRFHIQNVSDEVIQIARVTGQTDPGYWIVEDVEGGNARIARTMRWTGRQRQIDRRKLNPGEKAVLDSEEPLGLQRSVKERVMGTKKGMVFDESGRYSFRYLLRFRELESGDWTGELETGKIDLRINVLSKRGQTI